MMNSQHAHKLDNPVWYALSETHSGFSVNLDHSKFYHPDYCPFGGSIHPEQISTDISAYSLLADNFYVVGEKPVFSADLKINKHLVCDQMVIDKQPGIYILEDIIFLNEHYTLELQELVNLVQPGYFRGKTSSLGNYYGIFKDAMLVAAAGERMRMDEYTEVSAIVTHPDHTGKGYAKQLITHAVNNIFSQNRIPFLHVAEDNAGAIHLYHKLGFVTRRKMSFWNITR